MTGAEYESAMKTVPKFERGTRGAQADLRRMVDLDPVRPGLDRARLGDYGIPVWAIIGHVLTIAGDAIDDESSQGVIELVAEDYQIPPVAVDAGLLYYREHREAIDTRLAINAGNG